MVEPNKIILLVQSTIPQKEDIILFYIGYTIVYPNKILLSWEKRRKPLDPKPPGLRPLCQLHQEPLSRVLEIGVQGLGFLNPEDLMRRAQDSGFKVYRYRALELEFRVYCLGASDSGIKVLRGTQIQRGV